MDGLKTLYDRFSENIIRLTKSNGMLQMLATEFIFKEVSESAVVQLTTRQRKPFPAFNIDALKNEEVLLQTIRVLTLMEASTSLNEFEHMNKKRKENIKKEDIKEPQGFNKILKGIMKVPKPKEKKEEKQ